MTRPWRDKPAAFARLLDGKGRVLVVLDFDGTLAPLAERPSAARMGARSRRLLGRLSAHPRAAVAVLSGRALGDVERRVALPGLYYGGSHGLEVKGPGFRFQHPGAYLTLPAVVETERWARMVFRGVPGAEVESKGLSLAVHERRIPPRSFDLFHRRFRALLAGPGRPLIWLRGRSVWEGMPPVDWDKGRAAELIFRHVGARSVLAVGDDATDEDMFRAAKGRGFSVRVAPVGPTAADYALPSVKDVPAFLERFLKALEARP